MNNLATAVDSVSPITTYDCQVMEVTLLSKNTFQIELQSPIGTTLAYQSGQYLQLDLDLNNDGQRQSLSYSIANRFDIEQPRRLQVFIQNNSDFSNNIIKHLSALSEHNAKVSVTLPMGQAFLQTDLSLPHLLIAAGSGISKIKCLTEEILRQDPNTRVNIYWSNKSADEFYLLEECKVWLSENENLKFTAILESANPHWQGRSGYIYEVITEDVESLDGAQAYICGSPQMVYGTIDKLTPLGLKEENCYSDVFEYAPRH